MWNTSPTLLSGSVVKAAALAASPDQVLIGLTGTNLFAITGGPDSAGTHYLHCVTENFQGTLSTLSVTAIFVITIPAFIVNPEFTTVPLIDVQTNISGFEYSGNEPIGITYAWYIGGSLISGATLAYYAPLSAHYNITPRLTRRTILTNSAGSIYYDSVATANVAIAYWEDWASLPVNNTAYNNLSIPAGYAYWPSSGGLNNIMANSINAPLGRAMQYKVGTNALRSMGKTAPSSFMNTNLANIQYSERYSELVYWTPQSPRSHIRSIKAGLTSLNGGVGFTGAGVAKLQISTDDVNTQGGTTILTMISGSPYCIRQRIDRNGALSNVYAKVWAKGSSEPGAWMATRNNNIAFDVASWAAGTRFASITSPSSNAFDLLFDSIGIDTPAPTYLETSNLRLVTGTYISKTHYVAPPGSNIASPNGSNSNPFNSIASAISSGSVRETDTILLKDGVYGSLNLTSTPFSNNFVTIQPVNTGNVHFEALDLDGSTSWLKFKNLNIWRTSGLGDLINAEGSTHNLWFENLTVRSRPPGVAEFINQANANALLSIACSAFILNGSNNTVKSCNVKDVLGGIYSGPYNLIEGNIVDGFGEDGGKIVTGTTFSNNIIKNAFSMEEGYHRDGIQGYSPSNMSNISVLNNIVISWTYNINHPLKAALQGLGFFDGWYYNAIFKNNLVICDHNHGLTILGVDGGQVINNTVVARSNNAVGGTPYIRVASKKSGENSANTIIVNNIAMSFQISANTINNVIVGVNGVLSNTLIDFMNVIPAIGGNAYDYSLQANSLFRNTGNIIYATATDINGVIRPQGISYDMGAYERS